VCPLQAVIEFRNPVAISTFPDLIDLTVQAVFLFYREDGEVVGGKNFHHERVKGMNGGRGSGGTELPLAGVVLRGDNAARA
jgi:hypothetical protein